MSLFHQLEAIFQVAIQYGILMLECTGACVLLTTSVRSILRYIKKDFHVQLFLAQGIALSLEFKLGGEVLRTVIVRQQSELFILGAVILLRGALTFLIHWEIKNEEERIKA
ncbi:MAG: DUF1622 domain-containing protein [Clostridium sp.]|nr:DUF1622 domain-containing protein [Clostridium sp.]